jgi:hypothetical protein
MTSSPSTISDKHTMQISPALREIVCVGRFAIVSSGTPTFTVTSKNLWGSVLRQLQKSSPPYHIKSSVFRFNSSQAIMSLEWAKRTNHTHYLKKSKKTLLIQQISTLDEQSLIQVVRRLPRPMLSSSSTSSSYVRLVFMCRLKSCHNCSNSGSGSCRVWRYLIICRARRLPWVTKPLLAIFCKCTTPLGTSPTAQSTNQFA